MINLITSSYRPNRIDERSKENNPEYHATFARFFINQGMSGKHANWCARIKTNKRFYSGDQWIDEEDTEIFLKDETGNERNRIKVVQNVIRPMIEQYRGNALRLTINATAQSISPNVKTRRDDMLTEKLFYSKLARQMVTFADNIKSSRNVGDTDVETIQIFDNTYVDLYADKATKLIKFLSEKNKVQDMQLKLAENIAFSGLGALFSYEYSGHIVTEVVESERVIYDNKARKPDLSDARFQAIYSEHDPSELIERFQGTLSKEGMNAIEEYSRKHGDVGRYSSNYMYASSGIIPVFNVYWKDIELEEWGYVLNEYGYPSLERINYIKPGETKPKYTDKDLIDPPNTAYARRKLKNKKKSRVVVDVLRYCILTPGEYIAVSNSKTKTNDVIYEFGILENAYRRNIDPNSISFPVKMYTWAYVDGEILSPTDDAIDPQRMLNRISSVAESQINQSGGANVIIDKMGLDDEEDAELQLRADINAGRMITTNSRGKGIPNSIGYYDATPKAGTYGLFNLINGFKTSVKEMTGINEAMTGESMGSEQLVGVTKMMMQKGSLIQEPFYHAIVSCIMSLYDYYANEGKNFYIDNESELSIMVGDDGYQVMTLDKDMRLEDMRIFVQRENVDELLYQHADSMLITLKQMGMIDDKIFANLFSRSTPSEVSMYMRKYMKDKSEAARIQAKNAPDPVAQAASIKQMESNIDVENYAKKQGIKTQASIMENRDAEMNGMKSKIAGALVDMAANGKKE